MSNGKSIDLVLEKIKERKENHRNNKYILWLNEKAHNNPSINDLYKVALIGAYFYLSFTDINQFVLYYQNPTDKYMKSINLHTDEDKTHFKLFLHDFKLLGYDNNLKASEVLAFMWSQNNTASRQLLFTLYDIIKKNEHPGVRFCIVESIETQGNMLFSAYVNLLRKINADQEFVFFGEKHLALEQGHLVNQKEGNVFGDIIFSESDFNEAICLVNATWDAFEKWQDSTLTIYNDFDNILSEARRMGKASTHRDDFKGRASIAMPLS